jgi:peptidoglycan/xylan/chitin deacetylase (PgdA/CDA1 family)
MLSAFSAFGVRATLFVIAEDLADPEKRRLLEEAREAGHDFASHTVSHPNLRRVSLDTKRQEVERSRKLIEDTLGVSVQGFRAPGLSIDSDGMRALVDAGYAWDSSALPTSSFAKRLAIDIDTLTQPSRLERYDGFAELPLPDPRPLPIPVGPSYALQVGVPLFAWGMRRAAARAKPSILLFHLIDFAAPLAADELDGVRMKIFTLSNRTEREKQEATKRMLSLAHQHFAVGATTSILDSISSTGSA